MGVQLALHELVQDAPANTARFLVCCDAGHRGNQHEAQQGQTHRVVEPFANVIRLAEGGEKTRRSLVALFTTGERLNGESGRVAAATAENTPIFSFRSSSFASPFTNTSLPPPREASLRKTIAIA